MPLESSTHLGERARALRPLILDYREQGEAERRVPEPVVDALKGAELFRLWVPSDVGGLECEPHSALDAFYELARADASVGWITWNNSLPAVLSRSLDADTRREIFSDPRSVFANSTRPSGSATRGAGGARLEGRWSLVSGCEHAAWVPLMASLVDAEPAPERGGPRDLRMFFVPRDELEILDTWYTGGLRGSGSHDVVVDGALVPLERACSPLAPPKLEGRLHRFPFLILLASGCASLCLGVARASLDSLLEDAGTRRSVDPGPAMRERPRVQVAVAEAEAGLESARLYLADAVEEVWSACRERVPDAVERARVWRAVHFAARSAKTIVGQVYECAGTRAVYTDSPIDRCQRDIWTMGQHVILQPHFLEDAGRVSLGLEPDQPLF